MRPARGWRKLGTYKGKDGAEQFFAFPYKADLKSLVWYSPENFEDAGYDVPKTMEELKALTEKIAADGEKAWCIGLGSGGATGWPATDWVRGHDAAHAVAGKPTTRGDQRDQFSTTRP